MPAREVNRFTRGTFAHRERKDKGREIPEIHGPMRLEACYLCGRLPSGGIDRVDSEEGYDTPGNTRPCCSDCNYAKRALPLQYFLSQAARIVQHCSTDAA